MSKIYITSDFHYLHVNISGPKLSQWKSGYRNFDSIEQMELAITDSINSVVQPEDILYNLGDMYMGQVEKHAERIRNSIKCRTMHYVMGNHCRKIRKNPELQKLFSTCQDYIELRHKGILISLLHYPMSTWNEAGKGGLHFHGHNHGNFNHPSQAIDVGWDCFHKPIGLDEAIQLAQAKPYVKIDHHDSKTSHSRN